MEETPKKRGRPVGKSYPNVRMLRLKNEDVADLEALAARWRCSEAEALRRALRETAARVAELEGRDGAE